jgi:hypothetical protein
MKPIPEYILNEGGNSSNWDPSQDDLYLLSPSKVFNLSNQLRFWKTNVKIREHLASIRNELNKHFFEGDFELPRLSIVSLSTLCGINRKILYSRTWLPAEIESINKLATRKQRGSKAAQSFEELKIEFANLKFKYEQLLEKFEKQTSVNVEYFGKFKRLETKVQSYERIILEKDQMVKELGRECNDLMSQLNCSDNQRFIPPA